MSRSMFSHACMLGFVFFHAFMLASTCLDVHLHAYMHISIIYMLACFTPCLCAQAQTLFVMPCVIVALLFLLSHFLMFWPNCQDLIQTLWSLSSSIHQGPHKRVGSPLFACQCLLASMLYAYISLSSSRLCHAWCLQQVCGCVVTSDAHEALFECNHLGCIAMMPIASCIPFPFFTLCDNMLTMLVCATHWLSLHRYMSKKQVKKCCSLQLERQLYI